MDEINQLTEGFQAHRKHLRAVAFRMLGSLSEADDAVQEAWLRLARSEAAGVENLAAWLTTVVARVCLDMLRARKSRREEPGGTELPEPPPGEGHATPIDPEQEALLADSVGLALLVVLEKLAPAERLAFVLHDMFALSFEEIGDIVGRSPTATRQLASRARRRVQGGDTPVDVDVSRQREVVGAFLAATRAGDFSALVAVLDPEVVLHSGGPGLPEQLRGAQVVAKQAAAFAQRAAQMVRLAQPALIDGAVGLVVAPHGRLERLLTFKFAQGKIVEIDVVTDPARLRALDLAVLHD